MPCSGHRCQKQPSTNTATLEQRERDVDADRAASRRRDRESRRTLACDALRSATSGLVPRRRLPFITFVAAALNGRGFPAGRPSSLVSDSAARLRCRWWSRSPGAHTRKSTASGRSDVASTSPSCSPSREPSRCTSARRTARPVYLGIQGPNDERIGVLCYPFRCNPRRSRAGPPDEHRLQIRYGGEALAGGDHPLGLDIAGVDMTVVLGVHLEADLLIGLDPLRYDPLPMGISIEFKARGTSTKRSDAGWYVWEREHQPGRECATPSAGRARDPRRASAPSGCSTYVGFERRASGLGLDPPLRFRAAEVAATDPTVRARGGRPRARGGVRPLQRARSSTLIANRCRLASPSVAESPSTTSQRVLRDDAGGRAAARDRPGRPARLRRHAARRSASSASSARTSRRTPTPTATSRSRCRRPGRTRDDPAGRFYRPDQFDVVAACLYAVTGAWEFRYKATAAMPRHAAHPDRLAAMQRVDDTWADTLDRAAC